ncbi:MAG TPA: nucleotide exchange factor GrpE [Levilinea sp.]|nr:nucleotide exchange factor GrpE [Levilinea sp.]
MKKRTEKPQPDPIGNGAPPAGAHDDGRPTEEAALSESQAAAEKEAQAGKQPKEYEQLAKDLEQTRLQASQNLEGWQRERAEFSNYKKRIEREQSHMAQILTAEVVRKYLIVVDDLERALKARPAEGEGAAWAQGIELIYRKMQNILEAEGVVCIEAENGIFNPTIHEAISHEESPDHESGEIIEIVQKGYKIGERIIRPALVRVAR